MLFFDTRAWQPAPEETFIWVATRTEARWLRSDFGTQALATQVAALRCGLDQTAWDGEGQSRCADLLGSRTRAQTLPFDLTRAHDLYRALFGQAEDLIKDKHLLIVPSGHLTALPFQVLVTTAPKAAIPDSASGYRGAAWLARQHALTVLPSVASLKALRQFARAEPSEGAVHRLRQSPAARTIRHQPKRLGETNVLPKGNQGHPASPRAASAHPSRASFAATLPTSS